MTKGAIYKFADGAELQGEVFGWIEVLRNLSNEDFSYEEGHILRNIRQEISPYELSKIVDYSIIRHRKSIRNLKKLERDCQKLAVTCMVEQAYMAGARELLFEGIQAKKVSESDELYVRSKLTERWNRLWAVIAGAAAELLTRVQKNVQLKGKKSRPILLDDVNSAKAMLDQEILFAIQSQFPRHLGFRSDGFANHMRAGIVPEVKRYIREGKLPSGNDAATYQEAVDLHARRLRRRLKLTPKALQEKS